jgi:3-phosphoshikimate 1-carboxyvinyltransferase
MQRVTAAALLAAEKETRILNPSLSQDGLAGLNIAETLGAGIVYNKEAVLVKGGLNPRGPELDCGESGLSLRMFAAVAALSSKELRLSGSQGLLHRPVAMLEKPLRELGARCSTQNGFPPVVVQGPLRGGRTVIDGSLSSQFITGLLIALPTIAADSELHIRNLKSLPYVDMTLGMLHDFGIRITHNGYKDFRVKGGQSYNIGDYQVKGDWSAAAFWLAAGAWSGEVLVTDLRLDSLQADRRILEALKLAHTDVSLDQDSALSKKSEPKAFRFDASDCPDLFPPLVALACYCDGQTILEGVDRLKHKESDRALALSQEFGKLGANIRIRGNQMKITGGRLRGGKVKAHNDHRIAMALAVAALGADGRVIIEEAECVAKSYPGFFEDLAQLGGKLDE